MNRHGQKYTPGVDFLPAIETIGLKIRHPNFSKENLNAPFDRIKKVLTQRGEFNVLKNLLKLQRFFTITIRQKLDLKEASTIASTLTHQKSSRRK